MPSFSHVIVMAKKNKNLLQYVCRTEEQVNLHAFGVFEKSQQQRSGRSNEPTHTQEHVNRQVREPQVNVQLRIQVHDYAYNYLKQISKQTVI